MRKEQYEFKKSQGLCLFSTSCKEKPIKGVICETHRQINKNNCKRRRTECKEEYICIVCHKNKARENKTVCEDCSSKNIKRCNSINKNRIENNLCTRCGSIDNLKDSRLCLDCFIKEKCRKSIGDEQSFPILKQRLIDQNYKCYYTGIILIPGLNAGIDHKYPRKRFPELRNDINNLVWVDKNINFFKHQFTEQEFIEYLKQFRILINNDARYQ